MADVEVASVLPKELRLGVPPKMPQARSYLFRQQSTISSYTSGQAIQINIPRLQRSYLRKDSYLRFTLRGSWTPGATPVNTSVAFDTCGAWGLFEKIEVFDYLGSTVLESISGVPQLMSLLLDLGIDQIMDKNIGNSSCGLARDYVRPFPTQGYIGGVADGTTTRALNTTVTSSSAGEVASPTAGLVLDARSGSTAQSFVYEFSIPLPSFLGFLSNKMIPLHNGFTIVLTLATQSKPFIVNADLSTSGITYTGTAAGIVAQTALSNTLNPISVTWTVQDVNMQCQILELGPMAESMLLSSSQGQPFIVPTKAMRYYTGVVRGGGWSSGGTVSAGVNEFVLNLNLNVASLTNILWFMRSQAGIDSTLYASCGHRTRNFLNRWFFQYGSTTLPQNNGIQSMSLSLPFGYTSTDNSAIYGVLGNLCTESYNELMKARPCYIPANRIIASNYALDFKFNASLDRNATGPITSLNMLGVYPSPKNQFGIGRFACGLNLELAPNKGGAIISGLNTNGMNTSIRGQFHPNYLNMMDTVVVDAYAEYDAFINISPGIATTVSF